MGVIMARAVEVDLITKRVDPGEEKVAALKKRQEGCCSECGELLEDGRFEVCHIIPRASSIGEEGNALSNLTLKCKPCHNNENHAQDLSKQKQFSHTLASHPSPWIYDLFKWGVNLGNRAVETAMTSNGRV